MELKIKNKLVKEPIIDIDTGTTLGYITFNPGDAQIMKNLTEIIEKIASAIGTLKNSGEISSQEIEQLEGKIENVEDFENVSNILNKIGNKIKIESDTVIEVIDSLKKVFGTETINIITQNTYDIEMILPLIEFITPYVKEHREKSMAKYINDDSKSNVMK